MINLKNKQEIIFDSINGVSQREIAKKYGVSRNTVIKYIKEYQEATERLLSNETDSEDIPLLASIITAKPKYNIQSRKKRC